MLLSELSGRTVGILGAGREGQAAWKAIRQRFPDQPLSLVTEGRIDTDFERGLEAGRDEVIFGPLAGAGLEQFEVLIRSPGISPYREELRRATAAGVQFTTASNIWFAENPGVNTVCITGTKGKSTTTALTAHLLQAAGTRARVAGNIGRPMLEEDASVADWWVIELSSYQLSDLQARPRVGALLNLSQEHLDWHAGADNYRGDKLRLAELVDGPLIVNREDHVLREALSGLANVKWFNDEQGWHIRDGKLFAGNARGAGISLAGLPGRHNLHNLAAALTLVETVTRLPDDLEDVLVSFRGLPHRLHSLGEKNGLQFVDDSLSTTPVATLAALEALRDERVTLLIGGMDRGLDWQQHAEAFRELMPHTVIALPDNGPHILCGFERAGLQAPGGMHLAENLHAAVGLAIKFTEPGGVVLLSPGAPSFPHFSDYQERGEMFAINAGLL